MELIMLVGIPGSGKSTVARQYEQKGYKVHSSDTVRRELYGQEEKQGKASEVFALLTQRIRNDLKAGFSCVLDATNLIRKRRIHLVNTLSKYADKKTCLIVLANPEECLKRNGMRPRKVPENKIYDMLCSFETPYYYEGWDEIKTYRGENTFIFPREKVKNLSQDNPHHSLTLGEHLDKTRDYCMLEGTSEKVQEAAWYHDIGKMYTKQFVNGKGEITEIAHYYGHENYGAYLYLCEKACSDNSDANWEDTLYIANLINWHMKPLTTWQYSPAREKKDRKLMGEDMYEDLMQLHRADIEAH